MTERRYGLEADGGGTGAEPSYFDVKEMLGRAIRTCYRDKKSFLGMAAVVGFPFLVAMLLSMFRERDMGQAMRDPAQGFIGLLAAAFLIAGFVLVMRYMGAVPALTAYRVGDRPMSWTEAFAWVRDRDLFWGVVGVALLSGLAALGGFLLLVVPGFIFGTWFMLAIPSRVLGNRPTVAALSESRRLVRPAFKDFLLFGLALASVGFLLPLAFQVLFSVTYGWLSTDPVRVAVPAVVNYLVMVFWSPVALVGLSLLYLERVGGLENLREDLFL